MARRTRLYSPAQVAMEAAFPLRFQRLAMDSARGVAEHSHSFCEIGLTLSGSALHLHDGVTQGLEPGSFYVLTPGESHELRIPHAWTVQNIYYSPEIFSREYGAFFALPRLMGLFFHRELFESPGVPCFTLSPAAFARAESLLELLQPGTPAKHGAPPRAREAGSDAGTPPAIPDGKDRGISPERGTATIGHSGMAARIIERSLFTALLVLVAEDHLLQFPDHPGFAVDPRIFSALAAVETLLDGPTRDVVPAVGDILGMTREYASTFFHAKTGSTIRDYVLRRRVLRACPPLLEGRPVTTVAHELGFWDTPHFTRSFRKVMGCAPREYRARVSTGYSQLG